MSLQIVIERWDLSRRNENYRKTPTAKKGTTKKSILSALTKRFAVTGTSGTTVTGGTIIVTRSFSLPRDTTFLTETTGIQPMATIHCRPITTTMGQSTLTVICSRTR